MIRPPETIPPFRLSRHPIQYHNANAGVNPWQKTLRCYVLPVIILSLFFEFPRFMEFEVRYGSGVVFPPFF